MKALDRPWPAFDALLRSLEPGKRAQARVPAGLPFLLLRLCLCGRPVLAAMEESVAETAVEDLRSLAQDFDRLRSWSLGFVPEQSIQEKVVLLEESLQAGGLVWCGSLPALLEPCFSRKDFERARISLKSGRAFPYSELILRLSAYGYRRANFVEEAGEFAARGEIFDVWSPQSVRPVRLLFQEDAIESMHAFDVFTQRTVEFLPEAVFIPAGCKAPSGSIAEFLPEGTLLVSGFQPGAPDFPQEWEKRFARLELGFSGADMGLAPAGEVRSQWGLLRRELDRNREQGVEDLVFCRNMGEWHRLEDHFDELRLGPAARPQLVVAPLSRGFKAAPAGISVWSFAEMVGAAPKPRRLPKYKTGRAFDSMAEIRAGDFVVHEKFGIGRYRGLERMRFSLRSARGADKEKESEFLVLEYKGGDRLYVPIQDFRLVQKFVGAEGKRPQLNSMDGAAWERLKSKVRQEVAELAADLLKTAAERELAARPAEVSEREASIRRLEKEFEESFPYEETDDQRQAIENVMRDLASERLMDHLICGDVGYGKTEIAMRAAFRVACESRQVAVLVPTTILAEQHFKTFTERFADFPAQIRLLSRFQKKEEQGKVLEDLKRGAVDVVIGTHRLIQKDVGFKDLGLVIIDEEHRFGVKQKETLKKLKAGVDVLSMTATPIPRTLSLALGGVKNSSIVETPPQGRQPIETYVGPYDEPRLKQAVEREIGRGGQVFYVHNRVATIEAKRKQLQGLFPDLRIGLAHGQMSAQSLEGAMWNFLHSKWDVLLSTSIIESGLDIPSVNTLIVEDSQDFGLAQLYQLRGRVGRQRQKAYCYLFFSDFAHMTEDSQKRLSAIQEFSSLGSGMKLALRDIEIRGTGNLLGAQQHGWVNAVGLDLYCRLLAEEMERLKTDQGRAPARRDAAEEGPEVELNVTAFIPESYVELPGERILLYKKVIGLGSAEEADRLKAEFLDRFGPLPEPVSALFRLMDLKAAARSAGAGSVTETQKGIVIGWRQRNGRLPLDLGRFARDHPSLIEVLPPDLERRPPEIQILFKGGAEADVFAQAKKFLQIGSLYATIS